MHSWDLMHSQRYSLYKRLLATFVQFPLKNVIHSEVIVGLHNVKIEDA